MLLGSLVSRRNSVEEVNKGLAALILQNKKNQISNLVFNMRINLKARVREGYITTDVVEPTDVAGSRRGVGDSIDLDGHGGEGVDGPSGEGVDGCGGEEVDEQGGKCLFARVVD